MKKLLFLTALIAALISWVWADNTPSLAADDSTRPVYALVLSDTILYRQNLSELDSIENCYFVLPASYFVKITGEMQDGLYPCQYDGISGFVKEERIEIVAYLPKYVYPTDLSLNINSGLMLRLREYPTNSAAGDKFINEDSTNIKYYNIIEGEQVTSYGNQWYFVELELEGSVEQGYVYGGYVSLNKQIERNTIEALPEPEPEPEQQNDPNNQTEQPEPDKKTEIIFIVLLCLPVLFLIYLLFRKPSTKIKSRKASAISKYIDD